MRRLLLGLPLLVACSGAAPAVPATPAPTPSAGRPTEAPVNPDALCADLCSLRPTSTSPQAPALKVAGAPADKALVMLLWRTPNGESIEAIGAFNDLAEQLKGSTGVALVLVSIEDDGGRVTQARRELIDQNTPVQLVFGAAAQEVAAALAPDRLPATYVLDPRHRPIARFDGVPTWRSPSARPFFEGLTRGGGCTVLIDEGKAAGGRCEGAHKP